MLHINDYPDRLIHNRFTHKNYRPNRNTDNRSFDDNKPLSPVSYFNIPFFSDTINNKIRKAFRREGLNVRLSHKTSSLRSTLNNMRPSRRTCTMKDCVLSEDLCFRKNIIYKIVCSKCSMSYIGSTIRELHKRISEHYKNKDSSVNKHMVKCGTSPKDMMVSVLDHEKRKGNLRIREAYFIQKEKPEINSKQESSIDLVLF